jgi:DNA-binding CsgD family transcriptional regulator
MHPMLFDDDDSLWHVLSEGRLLTEKRMHAETGDDIVLIPIPVLRWGSISPVATELALTEDPYQAVQKQRALRAAEAAQRKLEFLRSDLTDAERKLVELLVREPMTNRELARRLHLSPSTIGNQLSSIYDKFAKRFHVPRADRAVLIAEFAPLLAGGGGTA